MNDTDLLAQKDALYRRLAVLAARPIVFLRMIRLHRINKRLDSLNRGIGAGKKS